MTNKDKIRLYNSLSSLNVKGVKFNYAVAKNISILEKDIEAFKKVLEPKESYTTYDKERAELAIKHSKKDKDGNPEVKDKNYVIEDEAKFEKAFNTLKETHKEAIAEREAQVEEYNKLLDEDSSVELYMIPKEELSDDLSTQELLSVIQIVKD